ncbi:hypothetical protein FSP39_018856 [Pinctada imbricata]|uniref:Uncharacterized protein n=1 Tax=Pinctada imbricata TaxID=66713 RepID=A0AA88YRU8_PINIB|nr:hypothetical protein FSP39_018856 [Pinctada imbricata]
MPRTHYTHVRTKGSKAQCELAEALCHLSKVPLNRKGCITDLRDFEKVLKVRILVIDSSIGNRFSYVGTGGDQDIYLYMVDQDHFHAIVSITGFFSRSYFCQTCLKPYTNLDRHLCERLCSVCKESHCTESNTPVSCLSCKMECRSKECYDRHKMKPSEKEERISRQTIDVSECKKYWKCTACCNVVKRLDRDITKVPHICGEWTCQNCKKLVHEPHQCYMRALSPSKENSRQRKLIFFDFECTQSTIYQCQDGYQPISETRKCCHCREDICGREQHLPNYVIVQKYAKNVRPSQFPRSAPPAVPDVHGATKRRKDTTVILLVQTHAFIDRKPFLEGMPARSFVFGSSPSNCGGQ